MDERELNMEVSRQNSENAEKVKVMIADKIRRMRGEVVDNTVPEVKRLTLEEAKAQGNTIEMIKIKTGYYNRLDQEKELNSLLQDIDIVAVRDELKSIETKITEQKRAIEKAVEIYKNKIKDEYEQSLIRHRANGGLRGGWQEGIIQSEYMKRLDNVESVDSIRALQSELTQMKSRAANLAYAESKFISDNASLIEEEKKRKKLEQIRLAGLV